jgi:hypothetical protein
MKHPIPDAVLRPGAEGWELWKFPLKGDPILDQAFSEKSLDSTANLLLALPSRSVFSMPLWIASQGDATELAELELTSRHLLRKDAEVYTVPILEKEGRSLVLALAATDDETAQEYLKKAKSFEIPARLFDPAGADILVWEEQGGLCFALYRDDICVFFAATGDANPGTAFSGSIARTAMRLKTEGVITRMPAKLRLIGEFLEADAASLGHALRLDFEIEKMHPAPRLPTLLSNAGPPTARAALLSRSRLKRLASLTTLGLTVYAVVLLFVAADLGWQRFKLHRLNTELKKIESSAAKAQELVTEWKKFRFSIDPQTFAIDQLSAVAMEIPGEQVRLTQYNYDNGRLAIAGEATDVAQAYEFFERVKKNPLLQDYDWTSRQPQLAGRNKVRFEMEGARPDAKTGEE